MIGLTTAIGSRYKRAARRAANRVKKHMGLETVVVLGQPQLDKWCPRGAGWRDELTRIQCLRMYAFDILSGVDRIFHFDADWFMRRTPDFETCRRMHDSDDFMSVWDVGGRWLADRYSLAHDVYFNGGFWIANRRTHKHVFDYAIANRRDMRETYADQCILNQALQRCGHMPTFFTRHWGGVWYKDESPVGIHSTRNVDGEQECNGSVQLDPRELAAMADEHYRPDGYTADGGIWRPERGAPRRL